jgi:regulator of cell morphogenesis and NO signaling
MLFSESASVARIATASAAAVRVFEQFGIDYSLHGDRSLADACREKGLDESAVSAEIDRAGSDVSPGPDWTAEPLSALIAHIVATHHDYLRRELPQIAQRLARVAEVYAERERSIMSELPGVFSGLMDEISLHMRKEEMMLFPAIEECEAAAASGAPLPPTPFGSVANPIRMMEYEHENAGGALARMRELTRGYTAPVYACMTYIAVVDGLKALEADLHQHMHLENNSLFPRALKLGQEHSGGISAHAGF